MSEQAPYFLDGSEVFKAPPGEAASFAAQFPAASPDQAIAYEKAQKYGAPGQQAIAGLEGLGRGLTARLSTPIETHLLGVKPEDIEGRERANPITAGGSEMAGLGLGLAVPGLSEASAPALIAKLGSKAGAVVSGTGLAAKALRGAVSLGTEGAAYGAGEVAHESALGDPALTAESLWATIGTSALIGGGLGAAGGILGKLAGSASASAFGDRVLSMLDDAEGHANLNATNAMPAVIKATIKNKGDAVAIGREARTLGILHNPVTDSPSAILERAEEVAKNAGQAIDDLAAKASGAPVTDWATIEQQVVPPVTAALRKQGATFALADQFEQRMAQYGQAYAGRPLDTTGLLGLKRDLAQFIYTNKATLDVWGREINTPMKRALDHVSQLVEDGVQSQLGSDGLAALKQSNRAAEVAMTFKTLAESGVARDAANNYVHASGMLGAVAGASALGPAGLALGVASEAARRRGASAIGATIAALRDSNSSIASGIGKATTALVTGGKVARAELAERNAESVYQQRVDAIRHAAIPEVMLQQIQDNTGDLHDHAPQTAQQYAIAHARLVGFLSSRIPPDPQMGPLGAQPAPTSTQRRALAEAWHAVADPVSVVNAAAAGQATPGQLAALAQFPAIQGAARTATISMTAKHGPLNVPRSQHGPISQVMGQPMHIAVTPSAILRNQAVFASKAPAVRPSQKGLEHLDVADRAMTPSQRSAQRR